VATAESLTKPGNAVFNRPLIIALLMCAVYAAMAIHSYHDMYYLMEIISDRSMLIETGKVVPTIARTVLMLLFCAALLELYRSGYFCLLTRRITIRTAHLMIAVAAVTCINVASMPFDSVDFAVYINHGWLQTEYGANPYTHAVAEVENWNQDPMFRSNWSQYPDVYGPVFTAIMRAVTTIGQHSYVLDVILIKAISAAAHIGITWMLLKGVSAMSSEETALKAAYLYGLNPYMLLHAVANGHFDIWMTFFSCLSLYLYLKGKHSWVLPACFLGVGIKYISVLMVPFLFLLLARTINYRVAITSLIAGAVPIGLLFFLYLGRVDAAHFAAMAHSFTEQGTLQSLFNTLTIPYASEIFKILCWVIFIAVSFICFVKRVKAPVTDSNSYMQQIIYDVVLVQALAACLLGHKFMGWYLAMFFPLSLFLVKDSALRRFCLFGTCFMLFSLLWAGFPNALYSAVFLFLALFVSRCIPQSGDQAPLSTSSL
jgi:hypothetical protein